MLRSLVYVIVLQLVLQITDAMFLPLSFALPTASDAPSSSSSSSSSPGFVDFTFTLEPQDMVTVRGGVLQLDCQAQSDAAAAPPSIMWRKDGVLLSTVVDERRRQLENGTLMVQNVVHSRHHRPDEGEYQCLATLDGLGSIVSRTAKVTVAGSHRPVYFMPSWTPFRETCSRRT
ncbi:hypothetical protein GOODEAATRI_030665 [Goodea atripinnis]|uniref:Ig-like domain-containing protein n=1 Tax=Goodea atripinnis TaxID=208336 RepID=A0ABV0P913_9TELE